MKIDCILVDDEQASRDVLRTLLLKFCPEINIVAEAGGAEEAYLLVEKFQPGLVFLDIQMPEENGFAFLKRFERISFDVIFVTSFNQFAINAIKFNALDYLLKPVEVADLRTAVDKAMQRAIEKADNAPLIINLLNTVDDTQKEKRLPLHVQGKVKFIELASITEIEADGNYSKVFLASKESILVARTLNDFEEIFYRVPAFLRINKSMIVNTDHIAGYAGQDPCVITMKSGKDFEISRRKKQEVLKVLREKLLDT